ncbi:carbon-nitrogen hydrolase family protein [Variovorax paradoxus]|uniref:carbon-nitrogen hydrolase family protein n=1 Tax=Variovorax paradoxus TaxID=34073 RepID=UPI0021AC3EE8|nr:carbon-nitrogen hydrolase family protein [Variovorax paradoxus]UVH55129.1 carbon-nitrogen hydrolase family protein [Variovorax paradoxus]
MKAELKISAIQMNSGANRQENIHQAQALMVAAIRSDAPDLLLLPEYFDFYGGEQEGKLTEAGVVPDGSACRFLSSFAREHRVWVHAGSVVERINGDSRVFNTTVVFDRDGALVATYRKIHLFDITAPDGTQYHESATVKSGDSVVTYDVEGFKVGCAICYDMRFSDLFTAFARLGVDIVALPAAFALQTGKDHWDVLLRSRAIETQAYVVAPAQVGTYVSNGQKRQTFGNSLVSDPWGLVIARASDGSGFVSARIQRSQIERARSLIPMNAHRKTIGI